MKGKLHLLSRVCLNTSRHLIRKFSHIYGQSLGRTNLSANVLLAIFIVPLKIMLVVLKDSTAEIWLCIKAVSCEVASSRMVRDIGSIIGPVNPCLSTIEMGSTKI